MSAFQTWKTLQRYRKGIEKQKNIFQISQKQAIKYISGAI